MKKPLIFFLLIILITTTLSACNSNSNPSSTNQMNVNTSDLNYLTEEFLVSMSRSGITAHSWNSVEEIPVDNLMLFYVAKNDISNNNNINWDTTPIKANDVELYITKYFDISPDYLHNSKYYDSNSNAYQFESLGGAASAKVISAEINGNELILCYEYYSPADDVTVIRDGTLVLVFSDNNYFYSTCATKSLD